MPLLVFSIVSLICFFGLAEILPDSLIRLAFTSRFLFRLWLTDLSLSLLLLLSLFCCCFFLLLFWFSYGSLISCILHVIEDICYKWYWSKRFSGKDNRCPLLFLEAFKAAKRTNGFECKEKTPSFRVCVCVCMSAR